MYVGARSDAPGCAAGMPHVYRVRQIRSLSLVRGRMMRADARDPPKIGHVATYGWRSFDVALASYESPPLARLGPRMCTGGPGG